jgi:glycosyltransferase involved in cell wall biosynthesis
VRIGLVSFWFTRGQAFVTREIRGIYRAAGHDTFVLARPDKLQGRVRTDGIWAEDGVTVAGDWAIPRGELLGWAAERRLDACHFFHNDAFDDIAALRATGVRTFGTFMWENYPPEFAAPTLAAFDMVYCMHAAQTRHFAELGILAPRVHWGIWPEMRNRQVPARDPGAPITFYYPAGYLEIRRAVDVTVKGFLKARAPNTRLLVKSTKPIRERDRVVHPQVVYHAEDVERDAYLDLLGQCDVCLSNTRWEGLGLVIYESIALGKPVLCPDFPPMSEAVRNGLTGLLMPCSTKARAPGGIPAADVRAKDVAAAVRRMAEPGVLASMTEHTRRLRDLDFPWERTQHDYLRLLEHLGAGPR